MPLISEHKKTNRFWAGASPQKKLFSFYWQPNACLYLTKILIHPTYNTQCRDIMG